jgi:xylose dehydrogenase (NAD/NADP)
MFKNSEIKWGVLGTARIAQKKMIRAVQAEGNKCIAIASRDRRRAEKISQEFAIETSYFGNTKNLYEGYDKLLKNDSIDAVYIPLPNSLHYEWVTRAAKMGKHILCEKPLGCTLAQVQDMIKICKEQKVVLLEAFSYSLHPQYERLFAFLKKEMIGTVNSVQVYFSYPATKEKHAIRFQSHLGGGSLFDIGCYGVDIAHRIYDQAPQSVDASFSVKNGIDLEFLGFLKFDDNNDAMIRTSFLQWRRQTLLVSGEEGLIFLPSAFVPMDDKVSLFVKTKTRSRVEELKNVDQYALLIQKFRTLILTGQNMDSSYKRSLRNAGTLDRLLAKRKK